MPYLPVMSGLKSGNAFPMKSNKSILKFLIRFVPSAEWAKKAKAAGMKYAVITAKHHEGFCMFDSKFTDYDVMIRHMEKIL
jgi:hypothetical protein